MVTIKNLDRHCRAYGLRIRLEKEWNPKIGRMMPVFGGFEME